MYRHKRLEEIVVAEKRKESIIKSIILFLPLVLSVGWVIQIKLSQKFGPIVGGEMFSPIETQPLLVSLALFIIGYILFLFLMFSDDIRAFFWARKPKRHSS